MSTYFQALSASGDPDFIYNHDGDTGRCLWKVRNPMPDGPGLRSLEGTILTSDKFKTYLDCEQCRDDNATNTLYVRYITPTDE